MSEIFFNVEKIPVQDLGLSLVVPNDVSHAIVKMKEDNTRDRILSFCSPDYGLTSNSEIKSVFDGILGKTGMPFDFEGKAFNGAQFSMEWYLKSMAQEVRVGDPVALGIKVYNSYNRRMKFSFEVSIRRLVCKNGLTRATSGHSKIALHTSGIEGIGSAELCMPLLMEAIEDFDNMLEPFEDLAYIPVPNIESRLDEVIGETDFPTSLRDVAMERIILEMAEFQFPATDWLVYNGLNYALNHHSNLFGRKFEAVDREVLTYMLG